MQTLLQERGLFRFAKRNGERLAQERASCLLTAGIDLDGAMRSSAEERRKVAVRLQRLIERERLKGTRGHWSYDLNRHIALRSALARIRQNPPESSI